MNEQAREIMTSASEYIERLVPGIKGLISDIQTGKSYPLSKIEDIFEGMKWIMQAFEGIREQISIPVDIPRINDTLRELMDALENNDRVLIADLLGYEIIPVLEGIYDEIDLATKGSNSSHNEPNE